MKDINLFDTEDSIYLKKAKFISRISWSDFLKKVNAIKFEAGQHFVLDQVAAKEIKEKKIATYIVGSLDAIDKILEGKKNFGGTLIGK